MLTTKTIGKGRRRQRGAVIIMITIAMFAILAMGALALDGGHLLLNKARLQNAVDAAALSGAVAIQKEYDYLRARQEGLVTFTSALGAQDFAELNDRVSLSVLNFASDEVSPQITVEFSERPDPFVPVLTPGAQYVRVTVSDVPLNNFFAQVMGVDKRVSAVAVAGPSTSTPQCSTDLLPMMVCAENLGEENFGYPLNKMMAMKISSQQNTPIGPGNFQLIRLGDNTGAADIRRAMAGESAGDQFCFGYDGPNATEQVETEPGNTVGPVAQGLNTRMGRWQGPVNSDDHPQDWDTCVGEPLDVDSDGNITDKNGSPITIPDGTADYHAYMDTNYPQYYHNGWYNSVEGHSCPAAADGSDSFDRNSNSSAMGTEKRREFSIVVADCGTGNNNGQNSLPFVGFACFYLMQEVVQKGNDAFVLGEFLGDCTNDAGGVSETPNNTAGPFRIVLYHAPSSEDS
ncbi:Tad domain-containing protein [Ferrimonas balearica]|uniref:TadE/TadG family type IV pilus assembly protein n=1 Tax=Ferrimonas balearica TaxID=44012 RepID=UPI001C961FF8|nr:TadE/TadG family type IV pilus assembly protein [Ferrimonas balearica]MBY6106518.1 Tad domain-containing protein [Ferrimonas balearica]